MDEGKLEIQSCLRHSAICFSFCPGDKSPGYWRMSLRDSF